MNNWQNENCVGMTVKERDYSDSVSGKVTEQRMCGYYLSLKVVWQGETGSGNWYWADSLDIVEEAA